MTAMTLIDRPPESAQPPRRECLVGLSQSALAERFGELGVPERQRRMRVSQVWSWIYVRGATDFAIMTDVAKAAQTMVQAARAYFKEPNAIRDHTHKISFHKKEATETALRLGRQIFQSDLTSEFYLSPSLLHWVSTLSQPLS